MSRLLVTLVLGITAPASANECSVDGREQTAVVATCKAVQVLRDSYGWNYRNASLELIKARYFDCEGGRKVANREFFATVETDDLMLALDVDGDLGEGRKQKGTWSSEDAKGIYIQMQLRGDKDVFQVNFDKKTNKLRYVMRHRKFLRKKPVSDVVFACKRPN